MRRCLNSITLGSQVPFVRSVASVAKAGFEGIEIFSLEPARKYAEGTSLAEVRSMFDSLGIEPIGFVLGGFVYMGDAEFGERLPSLTESMKFAGEIGAGNALLFIPSKGNLDEGRAMEIAIRRIGEACDLAAEHGLKIGLEPIGKADFLNTPSDVLGILKEVDAPNLGLTIDIFHFYTAGCKAEDLKEIAGKEITLIHVDDAPDLPMSQLDDSKRVLPGHGGMDLAGFFRTLKDIGFDGCLSVELFNRDLWAKDPEEVSRAAKEALDEVMRKAGLS